MLLYLIPSTKSVSDAISTLEHELQTTNNINDLLVKMRIQFSIKRAINLLNMRKEYEEPIPPNGLVLYINESHTYCKESVIKCPPLYYLGEIDIALLESVKQYGILTYSVLN